MSDLMKRGVRNGRGELLVDSRMSPIALPLGADGEERVAVKAGEKFEAETYTCAHCQRVVIKHPHRTRPREWCPRCNGYLCEKPCNTSLGCLDIRRLIELQQAYPSLDILAMVADGEAHPTLAALIDARRPHLGGLSTDGGEEKFLAQQARGATRLAGD